MSSTYYCIECGQKIDDSMKFCENCGKQISTEQLNIAKLSNKDTVPVQDIQLVKINSTIDIQHLSETVVTPKNHLKLLLTIAVSITVLLVTIVSLTLFSFISSPMKDIEGLNELYETGQTKAFKDAFQIDTDTLGSSEQFIAMIDTYGWDRIYLDFKDAALQNAEYTVLEDLYSGAAMFEMKIESKWGLFKKAYFYYYPTKLQIEFFDEQTYFSIAQKDFYSKKDQEIVTIPIIPGAYEVAIQSRQSQREELIVIEQGANNYFEAFVSVEDEIEMKKSEDIVKDQQFKEVTGSIESVKQFYHEFRLDYKVALDLLDPTIIYPYFAFEKDYRDFAKFIIDHDTIDGYHYDFYSNDVLKIVPVSNDVVELYSLETFDFYSHSDGTYYYEREKRYTIDLNDGNYVITLIETLNTEKEKK